MEKPGGKGALTFQIYSVPSQGGEAKKLTSVEHKVAWSAVAWSPDGRQIAYFSIYKELSVMPAAGGEPRVVVALSKPRSESSAGPGDMSQLEMAWSPDAKRLAYAFGGRLWTVALEGGEPSEVRTGLSNMTPTKLDWSPDGKTIAFTGYEGGDYQLWLMEDFRGAIKK
jgi:Tol biopolymer transport system component